MKGCSYRAVKEPQTGNHKVVKVTGLLYTALSFIGLVVKHSESSAVHSGVIP